MSGITESDLRLQVVFFPELRYNMITGRSFRCAMRKLLFIATFFLCVLISPSVVHAQLGGQLNPSNGSPVGVGSGISSGGKTGLIEDDNQIKFKVVNDLTEANTSKRPSIDSFAGRYTETAIARLVLCAFESTDCTGDASNTSSVVSLNRMIAGMYQQPAATGGRYVAYVMREAGLNIAQPAYAQSLGLGFASLDPILDTWKVFRNVAYLFYVILFVVIGFLIMFRQKISSQTVVTAQQALPNIIISLIAVTFSYAIAGLLIDLMYLIMYLIIGLFSNFTIGGRSFAALTLDNDIFNIGLAFLQNSNAVGNSYNAVSNMVQSALSEWNAGASQILGSISGLTFAIVFAIAVLFSIFRLFFELLKTYISIIISIVLSPLALMMGALPGNNAFRAWLKTLVANLAVFPGLLLLLCLSYMIIQSASNNAGTSGTNADLFNETDVYNGGFYPPFLPGRGAADSITIMVGLGIIVILPDLVSQIKKSLGGGGGIFEQFANNFTSGLSTGWKGGELIPGLGFTNTNKIPGLKQLGGLSGQNVTRKMAIGAGSAASGAIGFGANAGAVGMKKATGGRLFGRRIWDPVGVGFTNAGATAQRMSDNMGDEQIATKLRKERQAGKKKYGDFS